MKEPVSLLGFILTFILASPLAQASEQTSVPPESNLASSTLAYLFTTDLILQSELDLSYEEHRRDLFWPYDNEQDQAFDYGFKANLFNGQNIKEHYQGIKIAGEMGRKFSPCWYSHFNLGLHLLNNSNTNSMSSTPYVEGEVSGILSDPLNAHVKINQDYIYQDLIQPGGVDSSLRATSFYLDLKYKISSSFHANFASSLRAFSDTNSKMSLDTSLMYGISTGVPWIWLGVGYEYLSFSFRQTGYWSPTHFYSVGPRFEGEFPIINQLNFGVGLNVNHFGEESASPGNGYFGSLKLQYGNRNEFNLALNYIRILAQQNSNPWSSNEFMLAVNSPI